MKYLNLIKALTLGLPALIAGFNLIFAGRVAAQTFTTLHDFTALSAYPNFTNSDGAYPSGGLIVAGNTLYGTAQGGGSSDLGTVFKVNSDGSGFTALHSFSGTSATSLGFPAYTNSDGANPVSGFILSGNSLYGTAEFGGSSGHGTLFKLNANGTGFTTLHSFSGKPSVAVSSPVINSDGAYPAAALIVSGNILYGTTGGGGSSGAGTVFAVNTDGTAFTTLHAFTALVAYPYNTNSDGVGPVGLILSGNTLYGTAIQGGSRNAGTVFALNTDGTGFRILHHFAGYPSDGVLPYGGLILSGNTLYGTAAAGGSAGNGTVFAVNTDGTGFTTLHNFTATSGSYPDNFNSDGATPVAGLFLSGKTLYGTATGGGSSGHGTVFKIRTDGTGFTTLHQFAGYPSDGAYPYAGLILSGNTLYGTTQVGGSSLYYGTVFSLSLPPPVAQCKHVTVSADVSCRAEASIDGGSFDPDDDTITLVQSPPGPYPLGNTSVTLTVTDSHGASNNCVATVTVVDTTPPVITCLEKIVTDATSPGGAVVSFAPAASDNCSIASATSRPASGSKFAIGDTTVYCTATDSAGNRATCTFTVQVEGAAGQIKGLIALVQSLGLQSGTANSLIMKLHGAARALDRGNIEAACGELGGFLNEANTHRGKKLTAAQARLLIIEATRIRAVLGCGSKTSERRPDHENIH